MRSGRKVTVQKPILEINPNPALNPYAGLSVTLEAAGWTHARFTAELVRRALARGKKAPRRRRALNASPGGW